ncbi:MAG TPA: DUF4886 domain-containing protein, partial [Flavobacteriales bacterium]|nr:DUF4886 domain-containing protein [Flavobacteriales bacterium]
MTWMRALPLLPFACALPAIAQHTSVLFIGNSYTYVNDLPNTFRQLALSLGDTVDVSSSAPGGYTFEAHWEYAPTQTAIASRPWDVVVLQEQSQIPSFPDGMSLSSSFNSARLLVERIKQNRECTLPVFYMTWGRENGDDQNCDFWPPVCTYDGMQQLLRERYLAMATANHARTSPVGVAWKQVRDTAPQIDLYADDGSHPSVEGTYLAACVFYSTLFHGSSVGATFLGGVAPATAATLQQVASAIVLDSAATWALNGSPGLSAELFWLETVPPNTYIFHPPGQGQHLWQCSDGQTSTAYEPSFQFTPGDYVMTHIYTDLCGITDTASWPFTAWDEGSIGIEEPTANTTARVVAAAPGTIDVMGHAGDLLRVFDLQGRLLLTQRL